MAAVSCFSSGALRAAVPESFNALQKQLIQDGFAAELITDLYQKPAVGFESRGVMLFLVHRESTLNYDQFSTPGQIRMARRYLEQHRETLAEAEKAYRVPPAVITAILLVETQLGTRLGDRRVFNTLSTLAALQDSEVRQAFWEKITAGGRGYPELTRRKYEARARAKARWGYAELTALLHYALREGIDPSAVKGSYAGASGIAQFMPSSILHYAADGDKDGRIDLFAHADAIASVANYLAEHGWQGDISGKKAYQAVHRYNPSTYYVETILKIAGLLQNTSM